MPLQKQTVDIQFGGLDEKTAKKLVKPGSLLELENGQFDKLGEISKRNGFSKITIALDDPSRKLAMGSTVHTVGDELWLMGQQSKSDGSYDYYDGGHAFLFDSQDEDFIDAGRLEPWEITDVVSAGRGTDLTAMPYVAIAGGYRAVVWEEDDEAKISIFDLDTGAAVVSEYVFGTTSDGYEQPKVLNVGDKFTLITANTSTNKLYIAVVDPADPTNIPALAQKTADFANDVWDVCVSEHPTHGECSVVAYVDTVGSNLWLRWYDSSGTYQASQNLGGAPDQAIGIADVTKPGTSTHYIVVAWHETTPSLLVKYCIRNTDGTSYLATTTLLSVPTPTYGDLKNIAIESEGAFTGDDTIIFFLDIKGYYVSTTDDVYAIFGTYTGNVSNIVRTIWNCSLASKAFLIRGRAHVLVTHFIGDAVNYLQHTYFVVSLEGDGSSWGPPAADSFDLVTDLSLFNGSAKRKPRACGLPIVATVSTTVFEFPVLRGVSVSSSVEKTDFAPHAIRIEMDKTRLPKAGIDQVGIIGGGLTYLLANQVSELGFLLFPRLLSTFTETTGGYIDDGTYQYKVVFEWIDRKGKIHRSAPSVYKEAAVSGGGGNARVKLTVASLLFGDIRRLGDIRVHAYRTEAGPGTEFYKINAYVLNDPDSETVFFYDTIDDATLVQNEELYTDGGILANWAIPPAKTLAVDTSRAWLIPQEDPWSLWYTKPMEQGVGLGFNPLFNIRLPDGGKNVMAAIMDGNRILFKERSIYRIAGEGPNAAGTGGGFYDPIVVTTDVGCIDKNSVKRTDAGLTFMSHKGAYLLTRSLQVQYIGAPVEDILEPNTFLETHVNRDDSKVIFLRTSGYAAAWDYLTNQWSKHTNYWGTSITEWKGNMVMLYSASAIRVYDGSGFEDDTAAICLKVGAPWLHMAALTGYQRVWWLHLLGTYKSDCELTVKLYYDYKDTVVQTRIYSVTSAKFGPAGSPLMLRIKPARQKCSAIRAVISDGSQSGTKESVSLDGISLVVGVKGKRPMGQKANPT